MARPDSPPGYHRGRRGIPLKYHLGVMVVIANLAGMVAAVVLANKIRAIPETATTETWLWIAYYAALGAVALVEAFWIDEALFGGAFRRTHLQGKDAKYARNTDDPAEVAASMQRSSLSFPVVLALCGGLTYLLFNYVTKDFNGYYQRIGIHRNNLRGDDPEGVPRRLQAIGDLSVRRDPVIVPELRRQMHRGGEVGTWATWALGRFSDAKSERNAIIDELLAAAHGSDPAIRREAALALARLQYRAGADLLRAELERDVQANTYDVRLLVGAGFVQVPSLLPVLTDILQRGDERAQRVAAWALAQHRDQREAKDLDRILTDRLPAASLPVRCAIVNALVIIGAERANLALMHAYDTATPAERESSCSFEVVYLRPDGKDDHIDLFLPVDTYAMKILNAMAQARATSPEIRAEVEPWLTRLIADNQTAEGLLRPRAESLLSGIRTGRDDSTVVQPPVAAPQ